MLGRGHRSPLPGGPRVSRYTPENSLTFVNSLECGFITCLLHSKQQFVQVQLYDDNILAKSQIMHRNLTFAAPVAIKYNLTRCLTC